MNTSFEAANTAADRVAINAIVVAAADDTADRVAANAISSMRGHTPWLVESPPSPMLQVVLSEHEQIITTQKRNTGLRHFLNFVGGGSLRANYLGLSHPNHFTIIAVTSQ